MKETFKDLIENRHSSLRRLKEQGKRIIGYFCSYCPEEIVYAAGMMPVRILGGEGPYSLSSRHIQHFYCCCAIILFFALRWFYSFNCDNC